MEVFAREFLGFARDAGETAGMASTDSISLVEAEAEFENASKVFKSDNSRMLQDLLETVDNSKLNKEWYTKFKVSADNALADGDVSGLLENITDISSNEGAVDTYRANKATIEAALNDIIATKSPTSFIFREGTEMAEDTAQFDKLVGLTTEGERIESWLEEISHKMDGFDVEVKETPSMLRKIWKEVTAKRIGGILVAGSIIEFLAAYKEKHSGAFLVTRVGNSITKQRVKDISCLNSDPTTGEVPYPNNSANIVQLMGRPKEGMCHDYLNYSPCGGWEKWTSPHDRLSLLLAEHLLPAATPLPISTTITCEHASVKDGVVALVKAASAESGEIIKNAIQGLSKGLGITDTIKWGLTGVLATASAILFYKLSQPWVVNQMLGIVLSILVFFAVIFILYILLILPVEVVD
jgi:hypothetical protein